MSEQGLIVLRKLVGSVQFVEKYLETKLSQQDQVLRRLEVVLGNERQAAYHLLTNCIGKKFLHLARTTPPSLLSNFASEHVRAFPALGIQGT